MGGTISDTQSVRHKGLIPLCVREIIQRGPGKAFCRKTDRTAQSRKKSQLPDKMTLGEAAGLWLEENRSKWKESTYATYRSITEKHVLPLWGTQTADALLIDPPVSLPSLKEGEQKKYSGAYKHQIQIITSQIFHFLDKNITAVYRSGFPRRRPPKTGRLPLLKAISFAGWKLICQPKRKKRTLPA